MTEITEETKELSPEAEATPEAAPATEDTTAKEPDTQAAPPSEDDPKTEQDKQAAQPTDDAEPQDKPADRVVPEAADYVLPDNAPPGLAEFANKADLTQDQLDQTLAQFGGLMQQNEQFMKAEVLKNGTALTNSWGEKKDYNLSVVRRALKQNDTDGRLESMLNESGMGNHPAVLDFFLKIGTSMREGGFLKGANNNQTKAGMSAAQSMFGSSHPSNN